MEALYRKEIPGYIIRFVGDYLSNRRIELNDGVEVAILEVTREVPQGSVLGPILWNCFYDGVLELKLPGKVVSLGYADDLALLAVTKNTLEAAEALTTSAARVENWMRQANLEIAPGKTEMLMFSGKRRVGQLECKVAGTDVAAKKSLKYLGVTLDKNLSFRDHLKERRVKAQKLSTALGRLMPNINGPGAAKRKILAAVAASPVLYAARTWVGALNLEVNRKELNRAERPMAIRAARSYRTISTEAALVLGGVVPIHIQARSRVMGIKSRTKRRDKDLEIWQDEWARGNRAAWTRRLIPDLRAWVDRPHGELSHQMAQALSGHGCFAQYLKRIGKRPDDRCPICRVVEDAEHLLFQCTRWDNIRPDIVSSPETLISRMTQTADNWNIVKRYVEEVIGTLEREDRIEGQTPT